MTKHSVGIDISKDRLDAFRAPDARTERFSNDAAGFKELIDWMGTGLDCVALHGTGRQSEPLRGAGSWPPPAEAGQKTHAPTGGPVPCATALPPGCERC